MLLKTLLCFEGADQGARFALINAVGYLGFITFYALFWHMPSFLLLILLALLTLVTATSIRRINDSALPKFYAAIAPLSFASIASIILFSGNAASYSLMLIGAIVTLAMTLPAGKKNGRFVFGYSGPKNQIIPSTPIANRIEPTLVDGNSEQAALAPQEHAINQASNTEHGATTTDWVQPLRDWYQSNQKVAMISAGAVSTIAVLMAFLPSIDFEATPKTTVQQPVEPAKPEKIRDYALEMPSDYYLMLDQNDGLVIHWRTSDNDNEQLWSLLSGKGDKSCQALVFDDKSEIRTTLVSVENGGDYYADISPLDTKKAVNAIADKSHFKLCGYDFSLKGSRATIDGSETYYPFLQ